MCGKATDKSKKQIDEVIIPVDQWADIGWIQTLKEKKVKWSNKPSDKSPYPDRKIEKYITVPVIFDEEVIGILQVVNKKEDYSEENVSQISDFAEILAPFLNTKIQQLSYHKDTQEQMYHWQATFNSITDIVCVISQDHRFLEINEAGCVAIGLAREEIIGKKCFELVHGTDSPILDCPCAKGMISETMEVSEISDNGRYFLASSWPIYDENNNITCFSHSVKDITDKKLMEISLSKRIDHFKRILRGAMDGFWQVDTDGNLLEVNESYCKLSGYEEYELLQMNITDLEDTESEEETAAHMKRIIEKGHDRFETRHKRKDGSTIDVELHVIFTEHLGGHFIVFVDDISERKLNVTNSN